MRGVFRGLWVLIVVLVFGAGFAAGPAGAFTVDISQSYHDRGGLFSNPAWSGLHAPAARVVVPYDIAQRPQTDPDRIDFDKWIAATAAPGHSHVAPYVVFGQSPRLRHGNAYQAPSIGQYQAAMRAFFAAYGTSSPHGANGVNAIGAWNEPNFNKVTVGDRDPGAPSDALTYLPGSSVYHLSDRQGVIDKAHHFACPEKGRSNSSNCGELLAAQYWKAAHDACPGCLDVAGEFDSDANASRYWQLYAHFIATFGTLRPSFWSFHGSNDTSQPGCWVNNNTASKNGCITTTFHDWLFGPTLDASWKNTRVLDTEVPASSGANDRDQTCQLVRLIHLSGVEGVSYIYYYDFDRNTKHSALVNSAGQPRPAYNVAATYNQGGRSNPKCF